MTVCERILIISEHVVPWTAYLLEEASGTGKVASSSETSERQGIPLALAMIPSREPTFRIDCCIHDDMDAVPVFRWR